MPSPSDPAAELARALAELQSLRASVDRLGADNAALRDQLARSEAARADLFAQSKHVLALLADARREIEWLRARVPS